MNSGFDKNDALVVKNDEIPEGEWDLLLAGNRYASPFQSKKFFRFWNSIPNLKAEAVAIRIDTKLIGLVVITIQKEPGLKSFFSGRAIIYGGPVIDNEFPFAAELIFKQIILSAAGEQIYIETRNLADYGDIRNDISQEGWSYLPYLNFILDLKNKTVAQILKGMSYNRRREIALSIKNGAEYFECDSLTELSQFYRILSDLYRKICLPLPAIDFFVNFLELKIGKIFIVRHNKIIIGGSVCPFQEGRSIYTYYYCGLRDYAKNIFPSHLAIMASIEYGVRNGLETLDFMGAGMADSDYGVRNYKKEFGGVQVEYGRFHRINKPLFYNLGKTGLSILKRI